MKKIAFYLIATAIVLITACEDKTDKDLFMYTVKAPVTGVELDQTTLTIVKNSMATLKATVKPERAVNPAVIWSSSNDGIATVSEEGEITGVAVGGATITVTTEDGGKTATCSVTVVAEGVTGVELNETEVEINVGEEVTLEAIVSSEYADNKDVTWKSSDDKIATVEQNGKVTAIGPGMATITATTVVGGETATCEVTVIQPVTGVELNTNQSVLNVGESVTIIATVLPTNATNQNVKWKVNKPVLSVSIDQETGEVTATRVGEGEVIVTVITDDGDFEASCMIIDFDPNMLFSGESSKVWTWDDQATPMWGNGCYRSDTGPSWWGLPGSEGTIDDKVPLDGTGATMTFSYEGLTLVKERTNGKTVEGTFSVDLSKTKMNWNNSTGWAIGKLYTKDVNVLFGVINDDNKTAEEMEPIYVYDIIKVNDNEMVLSWSENDDPEHFDWGYASWFWLFRAVE